MTNQAWPFWRRYLDLAQPRLGAKVIAVSDDFFGSVDRLLEPREPVFIEGKYDQHGKWMDGWESRRRRDDDHDWCVIALGAPACLHGVDIDTRHFDGNQPQSASLEGAWCKPGTSTESLCASDGAIDWAELLPNVALDANAQHRRELSSPAASRPVTHLRLNIFPDGGVARLRAYGPVQHDWPARASELSREAVDLGAAINGGCVLAASDEHFGHASNLLLPDRGLDMGDGWETARRRGPGHDWVIVELGCSGTIENIEIDTAHFRGNFPHQCSVEATLQEGTGRVLEGQQQWTELVPAESMKADQQHRFDVSKIAGDCVYSHVRLNMYPDGGVSRLRILGRACPDQSAATGE